MYSLLRREYEIPRNSCAPLNVLVAKVTEYVCRSKLASVRFTELLRVLISALRVSPLIILRVGQQRHTNCAGSNKEMPYRSLDALCK